MHPEILKSSELLEIINNDSKHRKYKTEAELLFYSIKDWPSPVEEPADFIEVLKKEVKGELSFENLKNYLKHLDNTETWKKESIRV